MSARIRDKSPWNRIVCKVPRNSNLFAIEDHAGAVGRPLAQETAGLLLQPITGWLGGKVSSLLLMQQDEPTQSSGYSSSYSCSFSCSKSAIRRNWTEEPVSHPNSFRVFESLSPQPRLNTVTATGLHQPERPVHNRRSGFCLRSLEAGYGHARHAANESKLATYACCASLEPITCPKFDREHLEFAVSTLNTEKPAQKPSKEKKKFRQHFRQERLLNGYGTRGW